MYLCTATYDPDGEHGIHPLDRTVGIVLPDGVEPLLSPKDAAAPSLSDAVDSGVLPSLADCSSWSESLAQREN